ncbi:nucleotidyltransferase family protein [Enterococcus ureilyticus]|nr:nucleotidyltransferase family protein [Enterococcus ureilyticus]MBM7689100.1 hypothetical protein [Enterococcus ureilyticus]MBO0445369.1 nucleotidyltransferase family protein [Enterococcus ureilyticus]
MKKEYRLVTLLAKYYLDEKEELELIHLMENGLDWSVVLGQLAIHRIFGISWATVKKYCFKKENFLCSYDRFITILDQENKLLQSINSAQEKQTLRITQKMTEEAIEYVLVKGLALSEYGYPEDVYRSFNDNDILVKQKDLDAIVRIAKDEGYVFGKKDYIHNGIKEATRKAVLMRPLSSHEIYPLIKQVDNEYLNYHILDFQFSLDLFSTNRTDEYVNKMHGSRFLYAGKKDKQSFYSLSLIDLLLFVCIHFYKEAVSLEKVKTYKDLALYKLCDVHILIHKVLKEKKLDSFITRVEDFQVSDEVLYTFSICNDFFGLNEPSILDLIKEYPSAKTHELYSFDGKTKIIDSLHIGERVFDFNRMEKYQQFRKE